MSQQAAKRLSAIGHALSGSFGAAIALTITYPLDMYWLYVLVNFQFLSFMYLLFFLLSTPCFFDLEVLLL
jgi:hypothetical protein